MANVILTITRWKNKMIISIYGIPRCGKDTFIKEIINKKKRSFHLKGSETLNDLSTERFGVKFKSLNEAQQNLIRIAFTEYAKSLDQKYDLVIVDGHYSFPNDSSFEKVFTKADLLLYDAFFYLKRTPEEISRNFYSGDKKDYEKYLLSSDYVKSWIEFEISNMKQEVEGIEKDFIVLDSDSFSCDYVCSFSKRAKEIALDIVDNIRNLAKNRSVVLTDLDKTVSINDLTDDFIEKSNLDSHFPKKIFSGDYYTSYQFTLFHNYLMTSSDFEEAIGNSLNKLILNNKLLNDLRELRKESVIIAITTGMADAWMRKNEEIRLFDKIYGFTKENSLIITPFIKRLVSRYLSKTNKTLAIGDSIIDLGMVTEANKGYLVSMIKLDKRIISAHNGGEIKNHIFQPPYSIFKYDFFKEDDIKW